MQILLVEDDILLADGLRTALKREGFAVNHVATGKDALSTLATDKPEIVILDLGLPDMDGLAVLKRLRKGEQGSQVLILTARDAIEDKVAGLDLGADGCGCYQRPEPGLSPEGQHRDIHHRDPL